MKFDLDKMLYFWRKERTPSQASGLKLRYKGTIFKQGFDGTEYRFILIESPPPNLAARPRMGDEHAKLTGSSSRVWDEGNIPWRCYAATNIKSP